MYQVHQLNQLNPLQQLTLVDFCLAHSHHPAKTEIKYLLSWKLQHSELDAVIFEYKLKPLLILVILGVSL